MPVLRRLPPAAVFCLTAVLPAAGGCGSPAGPPAPPPATVVVAEPIVREVVEWDEYTGRLRAVSEVDVRARVGGYLKSIEFEDGATVREGDPLFVIDPRPYEAALAEARGRLESAKAAVPEAEAQIARAKATKAQAAAALVLADTQFKRMERLVERGASTPEDMDIEQSRRRQRAADLAAAEAEIEAAQAALATANAGIVAAQAEVEAAELDVEYTNVTAPIDGRIGRHLVDRGSLVSAGPGEAATLATIVSLDPIHAFVTADERAYLKYMRLSREGSRPSSRDVRNPAVLNLTDEQGYPHVGRIDFVDNRLDLNTDTITGRIVFPNPDGVLTPGLFGKVKILGSGRYPARLIPDEAVLRDQDQQFVLVPVPLKPDGDAEGQSGTTVARRAVTLGPLIAGLRVVRDGLEEGDAVVIAGLQTARPGSPVTVERRPIEVDEDRLAAELRLDLADETLGAATAAVEAMPMGRHPLESEE